MKKASVILCSTFLTIVLLISFRFTSNDVFSKDIASISYKEPISKQSPTSNEVTIGQQVWMKRNLNVDKFRNGDLIPYARTREEWQLAAKNRQPAWCYYDMTKYGKLYNWYAVNDPRGLAPEGWKVPSDLDWIRLTDYLGGESVAGGKMKSTGTEYWKGWDKERKDEKSRNTHATNMSGFSALPGGLRSPYGLTELWSIGRDGSWWSATEFDNNYDNNIAFYRSINHLGGSIFSGKCNMGTGLSVRCLRIKVASNNEAVFKETITSNEVTIGQQVWMKRNLNVDKFRNGDLIPYARTREEWQLAAKNRQPAWCYYDMTKYGKLYNWYAVNDPRGLAPEGWKVPSKEDWVSLIDFLKMIRSSWWKNNENTTNQSGFSGLPGGLRNEYGKFSQISACGIWWSSTLEESLTDAVMCLTLLNHDPASIGYNLVGSVKSKTNTFKEGLSVRCIKN